MSELSILPYIEQSRAEEIHRKFTDWEQLIEQSYNKFNLISQYDFIKLWVRHFLDSIYPLKLLPHIFEVNLAQGAARAIDVGSGAGFPGVALNLVYPQFKFSFVDSLGKRSNFLSRVVRELKLNGDVICARAEKLAHESEHRESYDFAVARALAKPRAALELLLPFLKIGGKAIFWAGGDEWNDSKNWVGVCKILGGEIIEEKSYTLPQNNALKDESASPPEGIVRKIFVVGKVRNTDIKYPRREGLPQKRPLS